MLYGVISLRISAYYFISLAKNIKLFEKIVNVSYSATASYCKTIRGFRPGDMLHMSRDNKGMQPDLIPFVEPGELDIGPLS